MRYLSASTQACVVFTTFVDANLYCDISGRSVTGAMHWTNQTVIDFSTKLQSTVDSFGSEYVAAEPQLNRPLTYAVPIPWVPLLVLLLYVWR
jgi:hypothetical protein